MDLYRVLGIRLRLRPAPAEAPRAAATPVGPPLLLDDLATPSHLRAAPHRRWVETEIVGELHHQVHIARIKALVGEGVPFPIWLETTDPDLVAVLAAGDTVGHILAELSDGWRREARLAAAVGELVTGEAKIFGGTSTKPSVGVFGKLHWSGRAAVVDRFGHDRLP
ncbi:MAG: hypothetical protein JWP11_496 [Frankiales bacterium]|nr:hypothetical protein [Frankiales bacterium]